VTPSNFIRKFDNPHHRQGGVDHLPWNLSEKAAATEDGDIADGLDIPLQTSAFIAC